MYILTAHINVSGFNYNVGVTQLAPIPPQGAGGGEGGFWTTRKQLRYTPVIHTFFPLPLSMIVMRYTPIVSQKYIYVFL